MADVTEEQATQFADAVATTVPREVVDLIARKAMTAAFKEIEYGSHYEVRALVQETVKARVVELLSGELASQVDAAARKVIAGMFK